MGEGVLVGGHGRLKAAAPEMRICTAGCVEITDLDMFPATGIQLSLADSQSGEVMPFVDLLQYRISHWQPHQIPEKIDWYSATVRIKTDCPLLPCNYSPGLQLPQQELHKRIMGTTGHFSTLDLSREAQYGNPR